MSGFSEIHVLVGDYSDTLVGADSGAIFTIDGSNAGSIGTGFSFSKVENLTGGSGNDTFIFSGLGSLDGALLGGSGTDTLDYSAYDKGDGSGVYVDLGSGTATGAAQTGQIENLIGSEFDDILSGDNQANIITGLSGNDTLSGGGGNDTYVFAGEWGDDTVVETAGGGSDALDFTAVTAGLLFTLGDDYSVSDGINAATHAGRYIEVLRGGSGNDTFAFTGSGSVSGTIDGQGGAIPDYSGYGTNKRKSADLQPQEDIQRYPCLAGALLQIPDWDQCRYRLQAHGGEERERLMMVSALPAREPQGGTVLMPDYSAYGEAVTVICSVRYRAERFRLYQN